MCILLVYRWNIHTNANVDHGIVFRNRICIIQKFYAAFPYIPECVIFHRDSFVCFSGHHAVSSHTGKNIFKCISLNEKIFAGTSIVGHILRKNISFICTAVDLNALLTALFVIFIIATEFTVSDRCVFHASKFQKMWFQIIEKSRIFNGYVVCMANAESYKTAWLIFAFYALIIIVPGSTINNDILISWITACWFFRISKSQDQMLGRRSFGDRCSLCVQIHIAVHTERPGKFIMSRWNDDLIRCLTRCPIFQFQEQRI